MVARRTCTYLQAFINSRKQILNELKKKKKKEPSKVFNSLPVATTQQLGLRCFGKIPQILPETLNF